MTEEIEIPGYNGDYTMTKNGDVFSYKRGRRVLMKSTLSKGYQYLGLNLFGKRKTHKIHRLLAEFFIPNPHGHTEVNHIDGDKSNNCLTNLEWCSRIHNMQHASTTGLIKTKEVIQLTKDGVEVKRYKGLGAVNAAGFAKSNVRSCIIGRYKYAYGFGWCYAN